MEKTQKKPLWRRVLRRLGGALLAVLLVVIFYVAVILGQPQTDMEETANVHQALVPASPAVNLTAGQSIDAAVAAFPVPVLCAAQGSGLSLTGGTSYDTAFEDGLARILTLEYADAQGRAVQVTSIYPARAIALLRDDGYRLTGAGVALAGADSVRMDGKGHTRLHAQTAMGLYAVTMQQMADEDMKELLRPLTLQGGGQ